MDTTIAYEIVEDTSPIAFYKPTRIIITSDQHQMLLKAGLIKAMASTTSREVLGRITKSQFQNHAAKLAHDIEKLRKDTESAQSVDY